MTEEFKEVAVRELRKSFPFAVDRQILEMAKVMWELIPRIYNPASNDDK